MTQRRTAKKATKQGSKPLGKTSKPKVRAEAKRPLPAGLSNEKAISRWNAISQFLAAGKHGEHLFDAAAQYATAYQEWVEAASKVTASNALLKSNNGKPVENPFIKLRDNAAKRMEALSERLPSGWDMPLVVVSENTRQNSSNEKPWLFKPGQSGNPGGRPKSERTVKALAREYTAEALQTLGEIMRDKQASTSSRVAACLGLLDRGHGKPLQQLEVGEAGAFSEMDEDAIDAFIASAMLRLRDANVAGHA